MKKCFFILAFVVFAFYGYSSNYIKLGRTPDMSKDKVVFVYQDDLLVANVDGSNVKRLVKAVGPESFPKFSPDGRWIAFTSYYNGNRNVYVIPAEGGKIRQITFEPEGAQMLEWSNDGKYIYYLTSRGCFSKFFRKIYKIRVKDGKPEGIGEEFPVDMASTLCFNDKGDAYTLNRHSLYFWWWKRYKGSANTDIWVYDKKAKKIKNLTKTDFNESWPIWSGDYIYFVSEENGTGNLFRINLKTKKKEQITFHKKDNVQWPSLSSDRKHIVYECNSGIWKLDLTTLKYKEIKLSADIDSILPEYEYVNPSNLITAFSISPTGKRVVFSARGEIFTAPKKYGEIRQITFNSGARDDEPVWSPEKDKIAFVSDRDGEENIYLVDQFAKTEPVKLTNRKRGFISDLRFSPDGNYLSYTTNDFAFYVFDIKAKKEILISKTKRDFSREYFWSPDSRWIVYTETMPNYHNAIYVYSIDEKKSYKLFSSVFGIANPVFSSDGKYVYFISSRYGENANIAMIMLQKEDKNPLEKEWDEEKVEEKGKSAKEDKNVKKTDKKEGRDKKKQKTAKVKIDFNGIEKRVELLPLNGYTIWQISPIKGGLYVAFKPITKKLSAKRSAKWSFGFNLYYYDVKENKLTEVAKGVYGFDISHDNKSVALYYKNSFQIVRAKAKAGKDGRISLANLSMKLDRKAEWHQIFNEAWRMVRDMFYDENLHGVDWGKMKRKYVKLVDYCQTRSDLNRILEQLVGELNASHQGARGGDFREKPKKMGIGSLGAVLVPDGKYYKFAKIYKGNPFYSEYNSPLDKPYVKVKEGDYLIKIDNRTVKTDRDYRWYLINKAGKTVILTVNDKPSEKGAWEIKVKPISSEYMLRYLDWVESNRRLVEKMSDGQIGYIHLNYMLGKNLAVFYDYIRYYFDKKGVIIDVRWNGGGGIDPQLIDYLERRQYQVTRLRNGEDLPRPFDIFRGKIVVLCNEFSYSDAEVFPNAFKVRKLGKLIGVPTLGFVIAVNEYPLIDGGTVRKTFIGIWDIYGNQLESRGAIPDIIVQNDPNEFVKGKDSQLLKAIEVLKKEIKNNPPKPVNTSIKPR